MGGVDLPNTTGDVSNGEINNNRTGCNSVNYVKSGNSSVVA